MGGEGGAGGSSDGSGARSEFDVAREAGLVSDTKRINGTPFLLRRRLS